MNQEKHLKKEFEENRKRPTLWAFFHLRLKRESFWYRGQHVHFYIDDQGQQIYSYLFKECIGFGSYNTGYKQDAIYVIDDKLDSIAIIERSKGPNGSLEYKYDRDGKRKVFLDYKNMEELIVDKKKLKKNEIAKYVEMASDRADIMDEAEKEVDLLFKGMKKEQEK